MAVYFCVIAGLLALIFANESMGHRTINGNSVANKGIEFCMIALLALVAGLRYNVGSDYSFYYSNYDWYKTAPLELLDEPGINIIARLSSIIYDDPATMMLIAAVVTVTLMTVTIFRNSDCYWLSILLYVFLCFWHGCFNGVRQYLASAVLFAGHSFIRERKLWKWLLIVFIASLFHITGVIGILFYFVPKFKASIESLVIALAAAFVGIRAYDKIFNLIGFLKDDTFEFTGAGATYLVNSIKPARIAVAWVPVIFFFVFKKYYDVDNEKVHFYTNMTLLNATLMTMAMNSAYLGRVGIYTGIYNTITWPILMKKVSPKSQRVLILVMLVLYAIYWSTEARGVDLVNFHWIFER